MMNKIFFSLLIFSCPSILLFSAMTEAEKFSINAKYVYKENNKEVRFENTRSFPAPVLVALIGGIIWGGTTYANSSINFANSVIMTGIFYGFCPLILRDSFNHIKNLVHLKKNKKQIYEHDKITYMDNDLCVVKVSQFEQKSYSLVRNFLFTPGYWVKTFFSWEDEKSFVQKTYKEINLKTLNQRIIDNIDNFVQSELQSLLWKCASAREILNNDGCEKNKKTQQEKIQEAQLQLEEVKKNHPTLNFDVRITPKPEEIIKEDCIYHLLLETKNNEKYYIKSKKSLSKQHEIVNNMLYIKENDYLFLSCDLNEVKKNKPVKIKFDLPLTGYYEEDLDKEFLINEDTCYVIPDDLLLWVNNYDEKPFLNCVFSRGFRGIIGQAILHAECYPQFIDRRTLVCFNFFNINFQNITMTPDQSKIIVMHKDHIGNIDVETLKTFNNTRSKKIMRVLYKYFWIILSLTYLLYFEKIESIIKNNVKKWHKNNEI